MPLIKNNAKISVLIITYNEQENLKVLLPELDFASEVIVLDSFSTDGSKELSSAFPNVNFFQRKFDNFSTQRNFALDLAATEWVLFLDADERFEDELVNEIKTIADNPSSKDIYLARRRYYFMNKKLKYCGWQNDKVVRFFRKKAGYYQGYVHEQFVTLDSCDVLKNHIEHHTYKDFDHYIHKLHVYAELKARELYAKQEVKPSSYHYFFKPFYRFLHSYIIRLGFLDGHQGLINCIAQSYGVFVRYVKLCELLNDKKNNSF